MVKVLVVEDTEEIWDVLRRRLVRRGYQVSLAHDGQSAIDAARTEQPDVILMDMNLPILDGWSASRVLKADSETKSIPIIAMTAHALVSDKEKALAAGCDDYHSKPIDFARLIAQISDAVTGLGKRGHGVL